jgi:Ca2+-binding EF-hand superfamily protein
MDQKFVDRCRAIFSEFDKDGSGQIEDWELQEALESMGLTPSQEKLDEVSTSWFSSAPTSSNAYFLFGTNTCLHQHHLALLCFILP